METKTIKPLAAFDIEEGRAERFIGDWPDQNAATGYRWIHLDLRDHSIKRWAKEHLPEIAARALCETETRPRCERLHDGMILNLRGVNLNPGSDPEDMVSLRLWVSKHAIVSARMRKVWAVDAIRVTAESGSAPITIGRFLAELTCDLAFYCKTPSTMFSDRCLST